MTAKTSALLGGGACGRLRVESPTMDGDLTLAEHERHSTLQSLETRIVDRADHHRPPEQLTVPAETQRRDVPVTQREAVRSHVHVTVVAWRSLDRPECQRPPGLPLGRADFALGGSYRHGAEETGNHHRDDKKVF